MRKALLVVAVSLLAFPQARSTAQPPRTLTLEDRVRAQLAIDRVYYSHQEGAHEPFEKAVYQDGVEQKVRTILKQSLALERFWHTPLTATMLRAETERMARTTQMPERLRELYAALGNDSFLIDETLARSVLTNRLVKSFYAYDQRVHAEERRRSEAVREALRRLGSDSPVEGAERYELELVEGSDLSPSTHSPSPDASPGDRIHAGSMSRTVSRAELDQARAQAPGNVGEIGSVKEDAEGFTVQALLESRPDRIKIADYRVAKKPFEVWWRDVRDTFSDQEVEAVAEPGEALSEITGSARSSGQSAAGQALPETACTPDNTWLPMVGDDSPGSRTGASVVWTGNRMIVWGGQGQTLLDSGFSYDPATATWTPISRLNAPPPRRQHTAVWTGSRMIVFGGRDVGNTPTYDGGLYDPLNDQWSPMNTYAAGPGRCQHTAVWTGSRMIVWGGLGIENVIDRLPRIYDPSSNTWSLMVGNEGPTLRYLHTAVWTGTEMVVWGGLDSATGNPLRTGARYNPATDAWVTTRVNPGAPSARSSHSAVWTGSRMLIWGGSTDTGATLSGARYDPVGNTWEPMASSGAPAARYGHSTIWTAQKMIVWGGTDGTSYFSSGGSYDAAGDAWSSISGMNAPPGRRDPLAVWTGSLMVVWGGIDGSGYGLVTGGRYDAGSDSWTPVSAHGDPGRANGTMIWTGSYVIIWGGSSVPLVGTGGRYDPATNEWSATSLLGAPAGRYWHTAVWTGTRMIVWGGYTSGGKTNEGGRYDPILDSWSPTSTLNAPVFLQDQLAVWTGSEMLVWGGQGMIGGRYNPASDTWAPMSTVGAPTQIYSTAVWAGSRMVVWGGMTANGLSYVNTGARYDPSTNTWQPTSTLGAPSPRRYHTAVWTGSLMVIFGGFNGPFQCGPYECAGLGDGGRYDPVTDSWQPVVNNLPILNHTAVWAGPSIGMIIWGGRREDRGLYAYFATGSRYNPASDTWTQISGDGAPRERYLHSAVWTGTFMIVWGGETYYPDYSIANGGRYAFGQGIDDDGDGISECGGDCNDSNPSVYPGAPEICDGLVNDCGGALLENADSDGDGFTICGGDCNDANASVHPGLPELCNGADDNCNGTIDEGFTDADADGYASCADCNDQNAAVHPGAVEACDGLDNDCSGAVDEGYFDADGDGYATCVDCNDSNPGIHPGATELCNGIDDNCASGTDEGFPDADGDGYASCVDCDDSSGSIHPGSYEVCNHLDDDCNGTIDEGFDLDGDGHSACFDDCDDQGPGVWFAPFEVQNLQLQGSSSTQLAWSDMAPLVGPLTFYDVYAGTLASSPGVSFTSATGLSFGQAETSFTDFQANPSAGRGYWYLLRAMNSCGTGTFGTGSNGQERIIPDSP